MKFTQDTSNWLEELFHVKKPIIAMCHLQPLPGDPYYDEEGGMEKVVECAKHDVIALQNGGVDGIMFSNEYSLPYSRPLNTAESEPSVMVLVVRVVPSGFMALT